MFSYEGNMWWRMNIFSLLMEITYLILNTWLLSFFEMFDEISLLSMIPSSSNLGQTHNRNNFAHGTSIRLKHTAIFSSFSKCSMKYQVKNNILKCREFKSKNAYLCLSRPNGIVSVYWNGPDLIMSASYIKMYPTCYTISS